MHKAIPEENISFAQNAIEMEATYLQKKIPVLCMIFVKSHKTAMAVKETWAKHCNFAINLGSFVDEEIPVLKVSPIPFQAFCQGFVSAWIKYEDSIKWMVIVDDKTYVIVENLRYYVASLNSSHPYYLGHPVKDFSNIYNTADAGIVLSHGALKLLFSIYSDGNKCFDRDKKSSNYYDVGIGKIMKKFEVFPVDTRDKKTRGRFNPFPIEKMLIPGFTSIFNPYWRSSVYLSSEGSNCCSNDAITFHGIYPAYMYLFEYMMYHLKPFYNSPLGLGNKLPPETNIQSKYSINDTYKNVGIPFIKFINLNEVKEKLKNHSRSSHSGKSNNFYKFWNQIFDT
ncbi:glycoprotein-N-acetylgalactosamine 3-beta-galactosyltransferase 1-like isoform X2 [Centruroides vittatus]